ncbi:hypothetical protein FRB99_003299 [Tulasnella sp. 403]|nr:hypothetical protein FRB99_003299 [Tulasnella sp. 403]
MSDSYGEPTCLRYTHSGKYLVAGTSTSYVVVWDIETGRISRTMSVPQTPSAFRVSPPRVKDLDVSRDDTLVASVLGSGDIDLHYLSGVKDGRRLVPIKQAQLVAFSPKSDVVAVGLDRGGVQIFSVDTGESPGMIDGSDTPSGSSFESLLSFSFDGRWVLGAGVTGIRIWDTRESIKRTPKALRHDAKAASKLSDDGDVLIFTDRYGDVHVVMNCFDDSAVRHRVESLGHFNTFRIVGSVIVGLDSGFVEKCRFKVWKIASYDSPGTYRIDRMPDRVKR